MKSEVFVRTANFTYLPITERTLEKIRAYGMLSGRLECYGFLISPIKINDGVAYDAILAPNQEVSGSHGHLSGEAAAEAKEEIENMGFKAIGFWHSHGNHLTFHSGTDDENMDTLYRAFAGNTEEKVVKNIDRDLRPDYDACQIIYRKAGLEMKFQMDKGNMAYESNMVNPDYFRLHGEPNSDIILALTSDMRLLLKDEKSRIVLREPKLIEIGKCKSHEFLATGFAYSIVTNSRGELYGEITVVKWCSLCEKESIETKRNIVINPIKVEKDLEFTRKQLEQDLEERVRGR
ncbi:MAG: Mov34/MPN/PAD-1 family protein [Nanoarchaeota archaeon]|nr:Mov34/MPN/PAD-1 family protein [Nanoarchaeota archaeon]